MMSTGLSLDAIDQLTNGRLGVHDVPCPMCGPFKSHRGQRRDVLRVWRVEPGFATFHCARCGEAGYVRDCHAPEIAMRPSRIQRVWLARKPKLPSAPVSIRRSGRAWRGGFGPSDCVRKQRL